MVTYILRRLLLMIPTLLGMTGVVFLVLSLAPGGIGGTMLLQAGKARGSEAARVRAYYEKRYHINRPLVVQYGRWLNEISFIGWKTDDDGNFEKFGFKKPSLGESMEQHKPVGDLIATYLPITLLLNIITIPLIYGVGIISGLRAARSRGGKFDTIFGAAQLATWSLPTIWVGVMLIGFLASVEYIKLFPSSGLSDTDARYWTFFPYFGTGGWHRGWVLDIVWHLILPIFCLSYGSSAFLTKLVRGSVLENLGADYARTARAKGLDEKVVLHRHVFRNSLLSLITVAAAILPALLSGSVIVETIFSIPGMGQLGVLAAKAQDREVLLAVTLIGGTIGLLSTLLRDILYALADPRVSYD